jgi:hypothetical protein
MPVARKLAMIAALLMAPAPALAQTAPEQPAAKPVKAKKICRSQIPTGRRISESICMTKAEWEAVDAANEANARGVINQLTRQASTPAASPNPMTGK